VLLIVEQLRGCQTIW